MKKTYYQAVKPTGEIAGEFSEDRKKMFDSYMKMWWKKAGFKVKIIVKHETTSKRA
jgi:hypothetical protein